MSFTAIAGSVAIGSAMLGAGYRGYIGYRQQQENKRFWGDYYSKTGIRAKYPYKAGAYYDYGYWFGQQKAFSEGMYRYSRLYS